MFLGRVRFFRQNGFQERIKCSIITQNTLHGTVSDYVHKTIHDDENDYSDKRNGKTELIKRHRTQSKRVNDI